jgi:hypothetical protein
VREVEHGRCAEWKSSFEFEAGWTQVFVVRNWPSGTDRASTADTGDRIRLGTQHQHGRFSFCSPQRGGRSCFFKGASTVTRAVAWEPPQLATIRVWPPLTPLTRPPLTVATLASELVQATLLGREARAGSPMYLVVSLKVWPDWIMIVVGLTWRLPLGRLDVPPIRLISGPVLSEHARSRAATVA